MPFKDNRGPIIACSTGAHFNSALALIRLSGFESLEGLRGFFTREGPMEPGRVYVTHIVDPETGQRMDHGMATYFKAPKSYTGEHMLELSVHGNVINVDRIVRLFCERASFLLAHPGEFTYRAMKNKKLTLSQVEGLDLLLGATSEFALGQGLDILQGEISRAFVSLRESFVRLKAAAELFIDFSEDVGEGEARAEIKGAYGECRDRVRVLAQRAQTTKGIGCPRIVLVGATNSGKSTLFNALLGQDRSIVSGQEGTTRDYVEGVICYGGVHYTVTDTAGWRRKALGPVEREGIDRAQALLKGAFYRVLVFDPRDSAKDPLEAIPKGMDIDLLCLTHADVRKGQEGISFGKIKRVVETGLKKGRIESFSSASGLMEVFFGDIHRKFQEIVSENPLLIERHSVLIGQIEEDLKALRTHPLSPRGCGPGLLGH